TKFNLTDTVSKSVTVRSGLNYYILWFRYSGDFHPEDVVFSNTPQPLKLDKPIAEQFSRGLNYKLFSIKTKFNYGFSRVPRPYGTVLVGFDFNHRHLNRNNLQYVTDVLGIGLAADKTFQDLLEDGHAISAKLDWKINKAWISQEIVPVGTRGDPTYVGHGAVDPDFSKITMGVLISRAEVSARDFISADYFVYLTIFGVLGTVFAVVMDRKKHGRFWLAQSWILRVMSWPVLLLAGGNLLLDFAVFELSKGYVDMLVLGYKCLWWLVPGRIFGIALERFLWVPLEEHTRRMVPNVIRMFGSVNIYILSGFGIIAFVFDEKITSLLATSGLLAMIIGLAIQANISNVFSGIAINLERPFVVGDWIKIDQLEEGEVVDITWRTIRIKTRDGFTISMPNGKASESPIQNFTASKVIRISYDLNVDANADPRKVCEVLTAALKSTEGVAKEPPPIARYGGTVDGYNDWGGQYILQFWISSYARREVISDAAWQNTFAALEEAGYCGGYVPAVRAPERDADAADDAQPKAQPV
ncbi:MAG: mechanosensitive ion channel family protein, partial [Proteobacteria bacterium]|nr:mechanosensitive ion channel family protein [Pseudomonadota bacterium]